MRLRHKALLLIGWMVLATWPAAAASMASPSQEQKTAHYLLDLKIGPAEQMFSTDDPAAHRPTTGEVMVDGDMSMAGMSMAVGDERHLEVHVYTLDKGDVVTDAKVAITVTGPSSKTTEEVPVVKMYGVVEGPSDTHYGNNVSLPPGTYSIAVTVNGESAEFTVSVPAS